MIYLIYYANLAISKLILSKSLKFSPTWIKNKKPAGRQVFYFLLTIIFSRFQ